MKKDETKFEKAGIKSRIINLLKEGREEALFSRELGEIRRDVPIDFLIPKLSWKESVETKNILNLFSELSFRTLSDRVKKLFDIKEEIKVREENNSPDEIKKTAIALWLLNSDITNPGLDEILQFAKTNSFLKAKKYIFDELQKQGFKSLFTKVEEPLIRVIEKIKERGVKINTDYLKKLSDEYHKELVKIQSKIYKHAGVEFNINSPKQLGEVLYDKLNLAGKNMKKTSTGAKSTRESELIKLKGGHPIIDEILGYRELQKLLSTYIDNIPEMVKEDNRLHADFNQAGTTTGRMSSQNPNLQNIPIKSELGRRIRNAFITEKGYKLVSFDYSQIELRIAAFLSNDKKLIDVFKEGRDIHNAVASEVFGVKPEDVTKRMRTHAKTINFGILYGMGVNALRVALGTDRKTAQEFYNDYFEKFTGITEYLEKTKKEATKNGYTETFFGRRRYFPGLKSKLPFLRAQAERMAVNAPVQGTSADVIRIAMVNIDKMLGSKDAHLILQVHDELIYEMKKVLIDELTPLIKMEMENVIKPKDAKGLTMVADVSVGDNWGEMKEIKL